MVSAEGFFLELKKKEPRPPLRTRAQAERQYLMEQTTNTARQQDRQEATA